MILDTSTDAHGYSRMLQKKPSEIHPCLTDERIDIIGHLIARVRSDNLDSSDDRDNGWSIGCRAHAWISNEIQAYSDNVPWLSIVDPTLRFIAKIDSVEFSFYKGVAKRPKRNIFSRAQSHPELRQRTLFFGDPLPERLVWAYAIETDYEGATTNVEFFGMSESGEVVASRVVPIHDASSGVVEITANESEPVELPPATPHLPSTKKDKADSEEHG